MDLHITLKPEILGHLAGFPVTNTFVTALLVSGGLALFAFLFSRRLKLIPGKFQALVEALIGGVLDYMTETLGEQKLARRYFPLIMTLFLFILAANWFGLFPGIGSIGLFSAEGGLATGEGRGEFLPLFHPVSTDLNATLALALIAFLVIETAGVTALGFLRYAGKFVNVKSPLAFFIGLIELFSEIVRLVSFSFRLFGNVFAGKVLILVAIAFIPVILPVPLMLFEVLVGLIQAAIFALLTLFFIKLAVTEAEH